MSMTIARVAPLLAALALLSPGMAVGGPPEGAPGRMVFDEVADGLRRMRSARELPRRAEWMEKLAPTGDPRVALALGEVIFEDPAAPSAKTACVLLCRHFARRNLPTLTRADEIDAGVVWWIENRDELRRRAALLPR